MEAKPTYFKQLILPLLIIILLLAAINLVSAQFFQRQIYSFDQKIDQSTNRLNTAAELDTLAQQIKYYDEVLTQSARNYTFTQQEGWKNRYSRIEPLLDTAIKRAIHRGTDLDVGIFSQIDEANVALVALELQAIEWVEKGQTGQALELLNSEDYTAYKQVYSQGLEEYAQVKRRENERAFDHLIETLRQQTLDLEKAASTFALRTSVFSSLFIVLAVLVFFFYRQKLKRKKSH